MKRCWPVIAAILFVSETGWAAGGGSHGAYATNPNVPGQYGFTFARTSRDEAAGVALANCGDGCEIVDVFSGGCGAYAIDEAQGITLGYASAASGKEAEAAAIKNCEALGGTDCNNGKCGCNVVRRRGGDK